MAEISCPCQAGMLRLSRQRGRPAEPSLYPSPGCAGLGVLPIPSPAPWHLTAAQSRGRPLLPELANPNCAAKVPWGKLTGFPGRKHLWVKNHVEAAGTTQPGRGRRQPPPCAETLLAGRGPGHLAALGTELVPVGAARAVPTEQGPAWGDGRGWRFSLCPSVARSRTQGHLSLLPPAVALLSHPLWHGAGLFPHFRTASAAWCQQLVPARPLAGL